MQYTKIFKSPPKYEEFKGSSLSALSYRHDESFDKTQLRRNNFSFSKLKNECFADIEAKRKKIIPGPGKYDLDKGRDKLTWGVGKSYK